MKEFFTVRKARKKVIVLLERAKDNQKRAVACNLFKQETSGILKKRRLCESSIQSLFKLSFEHGGTPQ